MMRAKSNGNSRFVSARGARRTRKTGVSAAGYSLFHVRVRAFAVFGDETVDPRGDNGQRYRAELDHSIGMVTTALRFKCGKGDTFKSRRVQFFRKGTKL
jgi:hypothetical protein